MSCAAVSQLGQQSCTELKREAFQTKIDGKDVDLYVIRNSQGMSVSITNYGARVEQILVKDRHGQLGDVVLGYDSIEAVLSGQGSMGAFIGRYANRIKNASFMLDGVRYVLSGSSHGGEKGSRFRVFDATRLGDDAVQMSIVFHDGEEGFPGTLPLRVVYRVTEANELEITYQAVAVDRATVFNFTNHTFFNLSGKAGTPVLSHLLSVNADHVLDVDQDLMPTGHLRAVDGTPMDFRQIKPVGRDIDADYDLLKFGHGYDHHYVVRRTVNQELIMCACLEEPESGRVMEVWSNEPGLQVFTANSLSGKVPRDVGKGGVPYGARSGICLEPSHFPDAPNHPAFPDTVLREGQWYEGKIVFRFEVRG